LLRDQWIFIASALFFLQVERLTKQMECLLTLQPQDGQFLVVQRDSQMYIDVMRMVTQLVQFPFKPSVKRLKLFHDILHIGNNIRLLFVSCIIDSLINYTPHLKPNLFAGDLLDVRNSGRQCNAGC
jgi:hypothetical protein